MKKVLGILSSVPKVLTKAWLQDKAKNSFVLKIIFLAKYTFIYWIKKMHVSFAGKVFYQRQIK